MTFELRHYDPPQLWYQLHEIVEERTYLQHGIDVRPGDLVLDVGANVGVAAVFFASECAAGTVHCFEPVAPLFELLSANVAAFDACVPHPYGLGAAPAETTITYYPRAAAMSGLYADPDADRAAVRTVMRNIGLPDDEIEESLEGRYTPELLRCELRTVSDVLREERIERVDLLKIDVERAELDVLRGISEGDWPAIRQIVAEVHDEDGRRELISGELRARGFCVVAEQEPRMRGTDVHLVYATRDG